MANTQPRHGQNSDDDGMNTELEVHEVEADPLSEELEPIPLDGNEDSEEAASSTIDQTTAQIRAALFNPRVFSKTDDPEGRKTIKEEIKKTRVNIQEHRADMQGKEQSLVDLSEKVEQLREKSVAHTQKLLTHASSVLSRIQKFIKYKAQKERGLEQALEGLESEIQNLTEEIEALEKELLQLSEIEGELPDTQAMLSAYYEQLKVQPLSNADKRKYLTPEVLADLSMEEYIALWRRLNPDFLTHVTRQGFRDHTGMIFHTAGLGEFIEGFTSVVGDEKILRTPIAVEGLRGHDKENIKSWLNKRGILSAGSKDEALSKLDEELDETFVSSPKYADTSAVHFASQEVADSLYGGETDNEIFFVFPTDTMVSQHAFGNVSNLRDKSTNTKSNDVFVWPSSLNNPGIPVDSGLVFMPKDTLVDPKTGSKYASKTEEIDGASVRVRIEDPEKVKNFTSWMLSLKKESLIFELYKSYVASDFQGPERRFLSHMKTEMKKIGFDEDESSVLSNGLSKNMSALKSQGKFDYYDGVSKENSAHTFLKKLNVNWKKAENPISSEEYWGKFFTEHPEQKPKHIVFYNGEPTQAVKAFQKKHKIGAAPDSDSASRLLGFEDNQVVDMSTDSRAQPGYSNLLETAQQIIEERFAA
jgi:hypothetical protein